MDSLSDILLRKDFDEPAESKLLKKYIRDTYQAESSITIKEKQIIIEVSNSSLANTLRLQVPKLKKLLATDKSFVFHAVL